MLGGDDGELVRAEANQSADREQPHQVDEPLQQRLVERRVVLFAHDAADADGRQPFAVRAVAAQRVEHVGDRLTIIVHRFSLRLPMFSG